MTIRPLCADTILKKIPLRLKIDMKITPLELRQFEFEKTFRGYSIEEVDMFINNLAQEWERVLTETKMMRMQLELAEKEAAKLREIEMTLFKTLKTAEDTSTMITEQANQQAAKNLSEASVIAEQQVADAQMQANKYLAEAKMQAEQILSNARLNANAMMQQADEQSRYVKEDVLSDVRAIENDFNSLVNYKEQLLAQMRGFATATVEHVERFEGKFDIQAIESKIQKANELVAVTPKEEENNITEEATEIDDVLVEMSVEEVTTEELEIEEEVLDNKVLTEEEVDEVVETFDEDTDTQKSDFVENIDEETIEDEIILEDDLVEETEEIEVEETAEVEEEVQEEEPEDFDIKAQVEVSEIEDERVTDTEEVEENYEDEVVESYKEAFEDKYEEVEDEKPDVSIINSIKEKIATKSFPEPKEEEELASVIPSSINKLVEQEVEFTIASGDDLTRIEGIGPKVQDILKDVGIKTFRDIATTPLYKIKEHLQNAGPTFNMIDASTWTEQALLAAEGRWDELELRQEELIGGREVEQKKEPQKVIAEAQQEPAVSRFFEKPQPVVEESESTVEAEIPAVKAVENNLDNITEEMLEKVNKVKSAIRKAMSEKSEKSEVDKEKGSLPTLDDVLKRNRNKGSGSFFDNID